MSASRSAHKAARGRVRPQDLRDGKITISVLGWSRLREYAYEQSPAPHTATRLCAFGVLDVRSLTCCVYGTETRLQLSP